MGQEKNDSNVIPSGFRASLEEQTAGGYIYVRTTPEGDVQQFMSFDNEISYLAILTKTRRILKMMEDMDEETLYSHMAGQPRLENDDDNDDNDHYEDYDE